MSNPYVAVKPGDLVTSAIWNTMQDLVRADIDKVATERAKEITHVATADDANKLAGNTFDGLVATVTDRVLERIGQQQGYKRLFKLVRLGEQTVIRHALGRTPLVDVYQLDPFLVACSEDDNVRVEWVTFYLHHTNEKQMTVRQEGGQSTKVDIQPRRGNPYRIPFLAMLDAYNVEYGPSSSLGDVETAFFTTFFGPPNDEFDDEQYCHSPWFDRCCGERRTMAQLAAAGDADDLWFQVRPRKTINFPVAAATGVPEPNNLSVTHFDPDTVGLELLGNVALPAPAAGEDPPRPSDDTVLPVMVLLKC